MNPLDRESDDRLVELARAAAQGDSRPFETLVERHRGFVVANCRVITRSAADSEDLAQDVFVKAFFGLRRFEGRSQFKTWLQRIKVNHCLNYIRKTRGAIMVDLDDVGDRAAETDVALQTPPVAHESLVAAADRERILCVLESMADTLRIPLMLRDGDGLSYEEIASELGIGLSAVKMRIKRAREEFRARIGPRPAPAPAAAAHRTDA